MRNNVKYHTVSTPDPTNRATMQRIHIWSLAACLCTQNLPNHPYNLRARHTYNTLPFNLVHILIYPVSGYKTCRTVTYILPGYPHIPQPPRPGRQVTDNCIPMYPHYPVNPQQPKASVPHHGFARVGRNTYRGTGNRSRSHQVRRGPVHDAGCPRYERRRGRPEVAGSGQSFKDGAALRQRRTGKHPSHADPR